jgi:hypothetical protein
LPILPSLIHDFRKRHTHAPPDDRGQFSQPQAAVEVQDVMAVVATLSKGYDLDSV